MFCSSVGVSVVVHVHVAGGEERGQEEHLDELRGHVEAACGHALPEGAVLAQSSRLVGQVVWHVGQGQAVAEVVERHGVDIGLAVALVDVC